MELKAFRVQNYKKIQDTDWIACEKLMVFVGKNESGKSALFRGLSKLKPTDGEKYDPIKEFPHGRYTDEFSRQDWPVASAQYALSEEDRHALIGISAFLKNTKGVIVTRHYSDSLAVSFEPPPKTEQLSRTKWLQTMIQMKKECDGSIAPDGHGDNWKPHKEGLSEFLSSQVTQIEKSDFVLTEPHVSTVRQNITNHMNEQYMQAILQPLLKTVDQMLDLLKQHEGLKRADEWVIDKMPYFLYFGNYEILDSAIYLPELLRRLSQNDKASKTRVQSALFKHVGVDVQELASLGRHNRDQNQTENAATRRQIDELDIKANAASIAMTKKFSDWWEQRRHKFTYKFHGDYFRIWVSDDLDPADVELEERSRGLQYFFSFYLLFLVEAQEEHRNCILLLDEPGIHLHAAAQNKLISFLGKISNETQTFYSTHSPFMIDGDHLERARAVYENPDGTRVSSDVWPRDRDTLFPLQAALGYSVCQALFIARKQIMVEGMTDYMLLSVLNLKLKATGKALNDEVILIPMGGTTNLAPLASMLIGHDIEIGILLDSDPAGLGSLKRIRQHLADIDKRCVMVKDLCNQAHAEELEDLIPEAYYLDAVARSYPHVKLAFNSEERELVSVVDRVHAFFERKQLGTFEKWRPIQAIIGDINTECQSIPKELVETAEKIFGTFNRILFPRQ